uniref:Uncharacterized protein n=1 Tax=Cacopsylla melanoneura TaxID=428564 RepID=A0A8D8VV86_9HEMI
MVESRKVVDFSFFVALILAVLTLGVQCDEIEQKLAKINTAGLPQSVLYEAAGINTDARTSLTKSQLAKALEDPHVQAAAIRVALDYATKTADIKAAPSYARGSETAYCEYSWVAWLPFMDCAVNESIEGSKGASVKETGSSCYSKRV